jgi:tetratricopeptide (TPR) repeat protein
LDAGEAIRRNPSEPGAYANRGRAHLELKKFDGAIADLDQAIRLYRDASVQAPPRAKGSNSMFEKDLYFDPTDRRFRFDDNFADAFFHRGVAYWNKGDLERARSDIDEAVRLAPGNQEARTWRDKLVKAKAGQK